jgi:GrpB-like predicted nucleotidyltransferase (UPF0157 family)
MPEPDIAADVATGCRVWSRLWPLSMARIRRPWTRLLSVGRGERMITVVDYDPQWPVRFEDLRREYATAMARAQVDVQGIEHVGSTAVPGLAAKPVIDCDIVVAIHDIDAACDVLVSRGFTPQGEQGIPQRWAFQQPARLPRTNTYLVVEGSLALRNHLCVRDTLRADAALRDEYAEVKKAVAALAADIDEYGRGKNATVQKILAAAGMRAQERSAIASSQVPAHDDASRTTVAE